MADAVTSTTLVDSDRVTVIQLTNTSDGTGDAAYTAGRFMIEIIGYDVAS